MAGRQTYYQAGAARLQHGMLSPDHPMAKPLQALSGLQGAVRATADDACGIQSYIKIYDVICLMSQRMHQAIAEPL